MKQPISIFWFRQDLRLSDNPGLAQAALSGAVFPIYILDDCAQSPFKMGGASKVYLHHALKSLNESLKSKLNIYKGDPQAILLRLIQEYDVQNVFWSRCYEPWCLEKDVFIEKLLRERGVNYAIYDSSYLWTPESIIKEDGTYYKVFGAYKRRALGVMPRKLVPAPSTLTLVKDHRNQMTLDQLNLVPTHSWKNRLEDHWTFGEQAAQAKLEKFLHDKLAGYKHGRDYPALDQTSKLSMHLHFGEISPHQIWWSVRNLAQQAKFSQDIDHFLSELIWREFSCYLLAHFKDLVSQNFQPKFDHFPYQDNAALLKAWQSGNTGYPLVDAGMRELWQTGYMHNRIRMVVASFLVKNLMIHWHHGRDWFWDCLVDADLGNNSMSWQWVAGCGVDAAPYFRIFNPISQGEKFDSEGIYTRKFVPELGNLPNKYLFKPWEAPQEVLESAGITLGVDYPKPIIDFKSSREFALRAYQSLNSTIA